MPWCQEKQKASSQAGGQRLTTATTVSHLHKDSEEDDHDGRGDEEPLLGEVIDQEDQGKADCSSQASVGDDELISKGHDVSPQLVNHSGQQQDPFTGRRGGCPSRHDHQVCVLFRLMGHHLYNFVLPVALQTRQSSSVEQTNGQLHM